MQVLITRATPVALLSALALLCFAQAAVASPVSVNLRVEGSSSTVFEGAVTTDAKTLTKDASGPHECDGRNGGANATPGPTLTTALDDGSIAGGFTWDATWSSSFQDFFVSRIGPDSNGGPPTFPSWGYALNYTPSQVGGCQQKVQAGDDVLFAYDFFSKTHLLKLGGPGSANVGEPVTVTVVDGQDGSAMAGASVDDQLTGSDGKATLRFQSPGVQRVKASRTDSVRSNALVVCVHNGNDGTCGTTTTPGSQTDGAAVSTRPAVFASPAARWRAIRMNQVFSARGAPRLLRGSVDSHGVPLLAVKLRLLRHYHGRCQYYSARFERLQGRCRDRRELFSIGRDASWSYLLPFRLPPGKWWLDVIAIDANGNATQLADGQSRVYFVVQRPRR